MARDTGRRGRDGSDPEPSPVDQLETWRTRRHDDTAEFPAVQWGPADRADGSNGAYGTHATDSTQAYDWQDVRWHDDRWPDDRHGVVDGPDDRSSAGAEGLRSPRRRRPGPGLLAGAALLLVALVLSGLTAVGVGPVSQLLGSGDGNHSSDSTGTTPSSTSSTSTAGGSSSTSGSASASSGSSGSSDSSSGTSGSTSDGGVAGPGAAAPSGAPAPNGSAPTGAVAGPAGGTVQGGNVQGGNVQGGNAQGGNAPGTKQGRPDPGAGPGGRQVTPPQPPAGGPGA